MRRTLFKSKIHRATVTGADLDYPGSVTVDPLLMAAADLLEHERVEIYDITNGERFATYAISGEPGRGEIVLNGAAAHKVSPGDLVIVCSYAEYEEDEARRHVPVVVLVDGANRIVERTPPAEAPVETEPATEPEAAPAPTAPAAEPEPVAAARLSPAGNPPGRAGVG